jgi:ubiquinone/menaquinone biosynthesis C-methylase UbiE
MMGKINLSPVIAKFLRVFFYLLYRPFAWSYDFVAALVSLGQWKDWVMSTLPLLEGPRILELGFGPGHLQAALAERGFSPFGLDASPQMAKLARRRLGRKGFPAQVAIGYAQRLPLPDESFDQIVTTFPPEFILAESTFSEAQRVLTPGGELIILLTAWITGQRWLERAAAWLFRVTGQAPHWQASFLAPISKAGLQPRVERLTQKSWTVLVILAKKPAIQHSPHQASHHPPESRSYH